MQSVCAHGQESILGHSRGGVRGLVSGNCPCARRGYDDMPEVLDRRRGRVLEWGKLRQGMSAHLRQSQRLPDMRRCLREFAVLGRNAARLRFRVSGRLRSGDERKTLCANMHEREADVRHVCALQDLGDS